MQVAAASFQSILINVPLQHLASHLQLRPGCVDDASLVVASVEGLAQPQTPVHCSCGGARGSSEAQVVGEHLCDMYCKPQAGAASTDRRAVLGDFGDQAHMQHSASQHSIAHRSAVGVRWKGMGPVAARRLAAMLPASLHTVWQISFLPNLGANMCHAVS